MKKSKNSRKESFVGGNLKNTDKVKNREKVETRGKFW